MSKEDEFLREIRNSLAEQVKKEMEDKPRDNRRMADKKKTRKKPRKRKKCLKKQPIQSC